MGCTCLESCKMTLFPTYMDHFNRGGAPKPLHNPVFADKGCKYFIGLGGKSLKMSLESYICQHSPTYMDQFYRGGARKHLHDPVFADKVCKYFIGLGGKCVLFGSFLCLYACMYAYGCMLLHVRVTPRCCSSTNYYGDNIQQSMDLPTNRGFSRNSCTYP